MGLAGMVQSSNGASVGGVRRRSPRDACGEVVALGSH